MATIRWGGEPPPARAEHHNTRRRTSLVTVQEELSRSASLKKGLTLSEKTLWKEVPLPPPPQRKRRVPDRARFTRQNVADFTLPRLIPTREPC